MSSCYNFLTRREQIGLHGSGNFSFLPNAMRWNGVFMICAVPILLDYRDDGNCDLNSFWVSRWAYILILGIGLPWNEIWCYNAIDLTLKFRYDMGLHSWLHTLFCILSTNCRLHVWSVNWLLSAQLQGKNPNFPIYHLTIISIGKNCSSSCSWLGGRESEPRFGAFTSDHKYLHHDSRPFGNLTFFPRSAYFPLILVPFK